MPAAPPPAHAFSFFLHKGRQTLVLVPSPTWPWTCASVSWLQVSGSGNLAADQGEGPWVFGVLLKHRGVQIFKCTGLQLGNGPPARWASGPASPPPSPVTTRGVVRLHSGKAGDRGRWDGFHQCTCIYTCPAAARCPASWVAG